MVASRETRHTKRVSKSERYRLRLNQIAVIYNDKPGSFFSAINFFRDLIVGGETNIQRKDTKSPTKASFGLMVADEIYEFIFSIIEKSIIEEELIELTPYSEITRYRRVKQEFFFDKNTPEQENLREIAASTLEHQLFLSVLASKNISYFEPIFNWFKENLHTETTAIKAPTRGVLMLDYNGTETASKLYLETLVKTYLDSCSETTRTQMILSTNKKSLMSKDLLRLDEIWFVAPVRLGVNQLVSFCEFGELKREPDIRRVYQSGALSRKGSFKLIEV